MNEFFSRAVDQVPSLAVLVIVVIIFLKSQSMRDEAFMKHIDEQNSKFKELGNAYYLSQQASIEAIMENTKIMGRMEKILEASMDALRSIGVEHRRYTESP